MDGYRVVSLPRWATWGVEGNPCEGLMPMGSEGASMATVGADKQLGWTLAGDVMTDLDLQKCASHRTNSASSGQPRGPAPI